ncbi:cysteine desulfurase [Chlamydia abortus]|uniref:aminotransferase class V-fold PLP-dependent enzyme n=1 Tax=Chlamydia abortus TaxID=83555 RepID=UPI000A27DEA9|nr:aminotransferase class V-fold PLP-dependent enzyme [Chlamydia abortus]SFZ99505.1 cysteine desulfurase [Chlamydia abortus]SGA01608.1 cysteine desulfurase [Chlamydia abortus]SGA09030.1 cysteine desulfurase [Chlamydia abortus]SGA12073.1 cysteine desulfurase [Chlamydia abortus]SGA13138.1 cysteine desulfurase [Chlamydia abortus]
MDRSHIRTTSRVIWLNNQQAIPPSASVRGSFETYADPFSLIPSSAIKLLNETEEAVRKLVGCSKETHTFHFLPHFPHAVMIIVAALLENLTFFQGRNHLLISSHEQQYHIDAICRRQGLGTTYDWVTINSSGRLSPEQLTEALTPRTLLFSLSAANGMTGLIEPIETLQPLCQDRGVILHLDLSDILGRATVTPEMLHADILTFSSLALGGIGNIGGMFIKKSLSKFFDLWLPSNSPGTLCLGSVAAMKTACQERASSLSSLILQSVNLRSKLTKELQAACPDVQFLFPELENKLPNVMLAAIEDTPAESLAFFLHQQGIYPGLGYERFQPISQILQNCGVSPFLCHSTLHFSFTERTKDEQFTTLGHVIQEGIAHLKSAIASSV